MKNIVCVFQLQQCNYCKMSGFFCWTPDGADYHSCPCCGKNDFLNEVGLYPDTKYEFLFEDTSEDDMRTMYRYCDKCNIMFNIGCSHAVAGCTSDVYNGHFIKQWKDKTTNIVYNGMPQFDNAYDWFDNANNVEVMEMFCPHNNNKCKKAPYPASLGFQCNLI
jgi:hypothetical protein